jgi:transcriptional regulator with XRE-family HTH domain
LAGSVFTEAYKVLLETLTSARHAAGMTQTQLAERLELPQSAISKIESGERRLDVVEFCRIATALSVDPPELLASFTKRLGNTKG